MNQFYIIFFENNFPNIFQCKIFLCDTIHFCFFSVLVVLFQTYFHSYDLNFLNSNHNVSIKKEESYNEYYNYLLGSDKDKWKSNVKAYKAINYLQLYDGVDCRFYSQGNYLKYDFIVSNPPYIKNSELLNLDKDVKFYEPKLALLGGVSGLEICFKIINKSNKLLKRNGKLILEIGHRQGKEIKKYLKLNGFNQIKNYKDLSGKDRCIVSSKNQ